MGWQLWAYRALSYLIPLVGSAYLRRRLANGKEHPLRWREKLGVAGLARPEGKVIWINAVGVGEVLSSRGLILQMLAQNPELKFLITSTARTTFDVLQHNLPPHCIHQFLPLDGPKYVQRFLRHWQPNLSIWVEQDLWPNAVVMTARQNIPIAMVNARITAESYRRRQRAKQMFSALFRHFSCIFAQDKTSADYLRALGARDVQVFASIKSAAPALAVDGESLKKLALQLGQRRVWLLASSWAEDEAIALRAHVALLRQDPSALLIVVPRALQRVPEIKISAGALALNVAQRSLSSDIPADVSVYIADSFGELGLWYRLCPVALIGGSFGDIEGHNPWEAAVLGCAILHGPRTGNFRDDYALLDKERAALRVDEDSLARALVQDQQAMAQRAQNLAHDAQKHLAPLAQQLIELIK